MRLRVSVLGCGGAGGVPSIGYGWGACDPDEPRNRRLRSSILIESENEAGRPSGSLLIDMSPDLREQLLSSGLRSLDGVLVTHAHADHIAGIDEMREVNRALNRPIPLFAEADVLDELQRRFAYCFPPFPEYTDRSGIYRPMLSPRIVAPGEVLRVGALEVRLFGQDHGTCRSLGVRIGDFAYSTDVVKLDETAFSALEGVDTWIVSACVRNPHPTHASVNEVLQWVERLKPRRTFLTHMGAGLDYRTLARELPSGVEPGFDGLHLEFVV